MLFRTPDASRKHRLAHRWQDSRRRYSPVACRQFRCSLLATISTATTEISSSPQDNRILSNNTTQTAQHPDIRTNVLLVNHQRDSASKALSRLDSIVLFSALSNNGAQRGVTRQQRTANGIEFRLKDSLE